MCPVREIPYLVYVLLEMAWAGIVVCDGDEHVVGCSGVDVVCGESLVKLGPVVHVAGGFDGLS